ncbi:MAG TPA: ABC transporter ATP-binding protein [Gemmatimonadales bacterium]|nr:ABC transporter ATP-binding protein [Gemmatimonadales bacterium]
MEALPIEARALGKRYGAVVALKDLSLDVTAGEVFGFLGPNGAGKTTTIRILLGLIRPDGGEVRVLGRAPGGRGVAARAGIGFLPGDMAFWPSLSGAETLDFLARLAGRPATARERLLERLGLGAAELARHVRTYSDGMKQKLGLVQALQCEPRLALLDEPTKGLDPLVQQTFYEIVADLKAGGATVFLSSHVLPEVERVCDRVAMLRAGSVVSLGDVESLRRAERRRVIADFGADVDAASLAHFGDLVVAKPRHVELLVAQAALPALVARLGMLPLADVAIERPTLEEAFLEHYR